MRESAFTARKYVDTIKMLRRFSQAWIAHWLFAVLYLAIGISAHAADPPIVPTETAAAARQRHEKVAARRQGIDVICHRGASEHAFENTLEAYRATFELGGDGNEIDIRKTKDGVLVVFHDDMLDRHLEAYGDVSDVTWEELRAFRFRSPGRFGDHCWIPTLVEVLELHRRHAGFIHLDIKRPGLDQEIADLVTRMDMWDHVAYCNDENAGAIVSDPRLKLRRYKGSLYPDRSEVFPQAIEAMLKQTGDGVIVDDPRGAILALGRKLGRLSVNPVAPQPPRAPRPIPKATQAELVAILRDADDWNRVAITPEEQALSGRRIQGRALAAEQLLALRPVSPEALAALEERVRNRSLHKNWMFHGFDGAMALRTLIMLKAPHAVELARDTLWRDDPALEPVVNPQWKNPRSWTDFRVKMVIFPALRECPGAATEQLCRDYLALTDEQASQLSPVSFEEAARTLLAVRPTAETAKELLKHRLRSVRGRAILDCLAHAGERWAVEVLTDAAPHALLYRIDE
jgi:hypothetical protein